MSDGWAPFWMMLVCCSFGFHVTEAVRFMRMRREVDQALKDYDQWLVEIQKVSQDMEKWDGESANDVRRAGVLSAGDACL